MRTSKKDRIWTVSTVGELREVLQSFTSDCPIGMLEIEYKHTASRGACLLVRSVELSVAEEEEERQEQNRQLSNATLLAMAE